MNNFFPEDEKIRYYMYSDEHDGMRYFTVKVQSEIARAIFSILSSATFEWLEKNTGYRLSHKFLNRNPVLGSAFGFHNGIYWSGKNYQMYEFMVAVNKHRPEETVTNLTLLFTIANSVVILREDVDYLQPIWLNLNGGSHKESSYTLTGFIPNGTLLHYRRPEYFGNEQIEKIGRFMHHLCESHEEIGSRFQINYHTFEIGGFGYHCGIVPKEITEEGLYFEAKNLDTTEQVLILLCALSELSSYEHIKPFIPAY